MFGIPHAEGGRAETAPLWIKCFGTSADGGLCPEYGGRASHCAHYQGPSRNKFRMRGGGSGLEVGSTHERAPQAYSGQYVEERSRGVPRDPPRGAPQCGSYFLTGPECAGVACSRPEALVHTGGGGNTGPVGGSAEKESAPTVHNLPRTRASSPQAPRVTQCTAPASSQISEGRAAR